MKATEALAPRRRDARPEGNSFTTPCGHSGCGCSGVAPCCFKCPLPDCRSGLAAGLRAVHTLARDSEVLRLRRSGIPFEEIAERFGISKRRVFSAIARAKDNEIRDPRSRWRPERLV